MSLVVACRVAKVRTKIAHHVDACASEAWATKRFHGRNHYRHKFEGTAISTEVEAVRTYLYYGHTKKVILSRDASDSDDRLVMVKDRAMPWQGKLGLT